MEQAKHADDVIYLNALNHLSGLGAVTINRLWKALGSPRRVWELSENDLDALKLPSPIRHAFDERKQYDPENLYDILARENILGYSPLDKKYPALLKEIYDPPPLLYCRGNPDLLETPCLTVVGTRRISAYGKEMCEWFTTRFVSAGITIVSGLAFGIDTVAHETTITNQGKTIAVLASGLDYNVIYPRNNLKLAEKIVNQGLLISERPPGRYPQKYNFPMRNRLASGISKATLVIEGAKDSGALITARSAFSQNRDVYAIPGDIKRQNSSGPNHLIHADIARLAHTPDDVLKSYNVLLHDVPPRHTNFDDDQERIIYYALMREKQTIDELKMATGLDTTTLLSTITHMELKRMIARSTGNHYSITQ